MSWKLINVNQSIDQQYEMQNKQAFYNFDNHILVHLISLLAEGKNRLYWLFFYLWYDVKF